MSKLQKETIPGLDRDDNFNFTDQVKDLESRDGFLDTFYSL